MINPQERFVRQYWEQVSSLASISRIFLPGIEAPAPSANTCILDRTPLSEFAMLPDADRFVTRYGEAPYALVLLGQTALLALVVGQKFKSREDSQVVVSLQHDRSQELTDFSQKNSPASVQLGRHFLDRRTGFVNGFVSQRHVLLGEFGLSTLIQDTNSEYGTTVAAETGAAWSRSVAAEGDEALYVPEDLITNVPGELQRS